MRLNLKLSLLGCALAGAVLPLSAGAADISSSRYAAVPSPMPPGWHDPYIHRESSGTWTNVEYNDGVCRYYYAHNSYDNETKLNKYGGCSYLAIGPDGIARPVVMVPGGRSYGYEAAPPPYPVK